MTATRTAKHYSPSDKATLPGTLSTKVVGYAGVENYPGVLHMLAAVVESGQRPLLKLARDRGNKYDPNAVAVRSAKKGTHLGHLPAALAARIAPELDAGAFWLIESYEVLVMPGHEDNPGLSLKLKRIGTFGGTLSDPARSVKSA